MRDQKRFLMSGFSMKGFMRFLALGLVAFLSPLAGPPRAMAQGIVPPPIAVSGTWAAFGPESFVRGTGGSIAVPRTFSVLNPNTSYTLRINNGGAQGEFARATGSVFLNGVQIAGPNDLNRQTSLFQKQVIVQIHNRLIIKLLSPAGTGIALEIVGVDNDLPSISGVISPPPNAAGWNDSNVTVSFKCSDKTSGVAVCPSPVAITTEGANQVVQGIAMDKAGNRATASITVNLDKTPPLISGTLNPPPDASGWNSSNVTVNFTCSDSLSRVAMCPAPVVITAEGANQVVTGTATDRAGNTATANVTVNISFNFFSVRNYGGKCLDYGAATRARNATVFLNDCAAAHPIRVQEINDKHEVILHAGTSVIGIHNPPVVTLGGPPPPPQTEFALELQRYNPILATTGNQIFSLDGDSIIRKGSPPCVTTATNVCPAPVPQLAVQVQNARGANGSPLVVGLRKLADSEFWDFNAIDGSDKDPTSGFVRVATRDDLLIAAYQINQIAQQNSGAAWGSVIKIIDTGDPINLTANPASVDNNGGFHNLVIPTGVTIRGDRRGTNLGPLLVGQYTQEAHLLDIRGDYARITGLRLRGPSGFTDNLTIADGIQAHRDLFTGTLIDHNDLSDWADGSAIEVFGGQNEQANCPTNPATDLSLNDRVRIERNFIHHNEQGYGAVMSAGGTATLAGNTFLLNKHAIAADGELHDQYSAWFNLVLSSSPKVDTFGFEQDFDMHGHTDHDRGGYAGNKVDIAWNTFFGGNRDNFDLRGQPCAVDSFRNNVSMQDDDDAVQVWDQGGSSNYETASTTYLLIQNNQFGNSSPQYADPTVRLGVGDFDGDGVEDLFLATGAAWYYSPAGKAEWRYLNGGKTDKIDSLLLGDFDGDGRTDVVTLRDGQFWVSWGGVSDWEVLNPDPTGGQVLLLPSAITAMAVGDFDGDGHADIFWADSKTWWVSFGGSTPFVPVAASGFQVKDLRFGDFDGNGTTDVFGVVKDSGINYWQVSYSPKSIPGALFSPWQPLRPALTNTVDGLVVGDFTGSGGVSVAMSCFSITSPGCWQVSFGGMQDWHPYTIGSWATDLAAVGHFRGRVDANQRRLPVDLLFWNAAPPTSQPLGTFVAMCDPSVGVGTELCLSAGGIFPSYRYTSQDMR
jgi:hypothetical protein